ncbi:hypothetical protein ATCC90586_006276 [Pythium insidiosum]|nr:hypothetical protein ATCC90586_006276 [Pythium insidiosum]
MLDDAARRALEEEAIALVNLSRPSVSERSPSATVQPARDDAAAMAMMRATPNLSMSVFVNGDGKMRAIPGGKNSPDHHAALDITRIKEEDASESACASGASSPGSVPDAKPISMQALLVTLKKRKLPETSMDANAASRKLPSFRDIFDAAKRPDRAQSGAVASVTSDQRAPKRAARSPEVGASAVVAPADDKAQETAQNGVIPPPELKCKYRTGKCNNVRALKSCGDYHNLCNYHRLRANANQRKLDRKKKVQRQQQQTPVSDVPDDNLMHGVSQERSGAKDDSKTPAAPAAAAAAALASLPTALVMSARSQRPTATEASALLSFMAPSSFSSLRPKEENACS